jgi:Carbohydrate binding domain
MTYVGYLTLAGTEIVNANRTAAYVKNLIPQFGLEHCVECDGLAEALGDPPYGTPLSDQPPWFDPDDPDTLRFCGFYPLSLEGIDNSTRESTVTELSTDGGYIGLRRFGTREIRVTGLLIAADDAALEAGLSWFRIALVGEGHCQSDPTVCSGDMMCYLAVCPEICTDGIDLDAPVVTTESIGSVRTGNMHTAHFPSDIGPAKAEWALDPASNTVVRVQAVDCDSGVVLEDGGAVLVARTNYAWNPSFETDLGWWTSTGGNIFTRHLEPFQGDWMGRVDSNGLTAGRLLSGNTSMPGGPQRMTAWLRGHGTATLVITNQDGSTHASQAITLDPAVMTQFTVSTATGPGLARFAIDTPAGSEYVIDRVLMENTTDLRPYFDGGGVSGGNLVTNPGFEVDATGWQAFGFGYSGGSVASSTNRASVGLASGRVAWAGSSPATPTGFIGTSVALAVGRTYTLSFDAYVPTGSPDVRATLGYNSSGDYMTTKDTWVRVSHTFTVTTGAGNYSVGVESATNAIADRYCYIDDVRLEDVTPTARDHAWLGPPHAAPSTSLAPMPLTIERDDSDWCPRLVTDTGEATGIVALTQYTPHTAADCIDPYLRHLHNVSVTEGPLVTQRYSPSCGAMVQVEFTAVAGTPWRYHVPQVLFEPGQVDAEPTPNPAANVVCTPVVPARLADPDCATVPVPPRPPVVADPCLTTPPSYTRGYFEVPASAIPEWKWAIPSVQLHTKQTAIKHLRVRFYPTPFGFRPQDLGPCDYCGEFIVAYIPKDAEMVIDGMTRTASTTVAGGKVYQSTHLLYGTGGQPLIWPELSCGVQYWMTVDVTPADLDWVDVGLTLTVRE